MSENNVCKSFNSIVDYLLFYPVRGGAFEIPFNSIVDYRE